MTANLPAALAAVVGAAHLSADPDVLAARSVDHTGRYRGRASLLVRPADTAQVGQVLRICAAAGAYVTVQGGRTSLVAGTVPEHDDVLLSTERLTAIGPVDTADRRIDVGAGVTLAAVAAAAAGAGLTFGVDLSARDSATVGGMAATNAGGLRTVAYGNMAEQVLGLDVVLPDGTVLHRGSAVRADNTGYNLPALFVGAEGTLGVITALTLRLHPTPAHRVTAVCGFATPAAAVDAAGDLRDADGIAALELIDGRAAELTATHAGVPAPVAGAWLLLVELAGDADPTAALADRLARLAPGAAAVGTDPTTRARLWRLREAIADVLAVSGPPLKFDVALPLARVADFTAAADTAVTRHAPGATAVLFGHLGEGNLHLNVLGCPAAAEPALYAAMMTLIAEHGGNVSSEHGVGSRKRDYLALSRTAADIAAMRTIKAAFDPAGYLNPAVLFSPPVRG